MLCQEQVDFLFGDAAPAAAFGQNMYKIRVDPSGKNVNHQRAQRHENQRHDSRRPKSLLPGHDAVEVNLPFFTAKKG